MERYDSYKDSGIEWIGEIPSHWTIPLLRYLKNSTICEYQDGNHGSVHPKNEDFVDEGIPFLRPTDIFQNYIDKKKLKFIPKEYIKKLRIGFSKLGDLIFVNRGNIGVTSVLEGFDDEFIIINPQLTYIRFDESKFLTKYFHFLSQSNIFKSSRDLKLGNGSVLNFLGLKDLGDYIIIYPTFNEQQQIVQFLDTKTSLIDSLIEKTQRKIELLKEKRTSMINEVVTKGLNPNVEMKDSGVEWIGEIPSHWEIKPLKYIVEENVSSLGNNTDPNYELDYIEISDVDSNGNISIPTHYKFSDSPSRCRRIVKNGDVIVSTVRTYLKSIGIIDYDIENLICSTGFSVLTPKNETLSKHLFFMVRSEWFISEVISKSVGVSYPSIQSDKLMNIKILSLPLSEQQQIVEYLDEQTNLIDKTISNEKKRIELLKEYRQSLISEVVTGKIKVSKDE